MYPVEGAVSSAGFRAVVDSVTVISSRVTKKVLEIAVFIYSLYIHDLQIWLFHMALSARVDTTVHVCFCTCG